ncbi:Patched domain-containing protein [Cymbomonas tetramitiformis]|uniref:Patched domain-containing protein n=1 Tax=Cymbomonas tetramitiformis TaxID=36881 RepID=A0AAE0KTU8_9CHLO|nr:Patched domain-containing protein [Cymbomonas tetramitiformis]
METSDMEIELRAIPENEETRAAPASIKSDKGETSQVNSKVQPQRSSPASGEDAEDPAANHVKDALVELELPTASQHTFANVDSELYDSPYSAPTGRRDERSKDNLSFVIASEVKHCPEMRFVQATIRYPLSIMAASALLPVLLSIIAVALFSINVDTGLESFRIRDHPIAELEDGRLMAEEDSSDAWKSWDVDGELLFPSSPATQTRRALLSSSTCRDSVEWRLHIIYTARDGGNVLTPEALETIRRFEERVQAVEDYGRFCYQGATCDVACSPPNSVVPVLTQYGTTPDDLTAAASLLGAMGVYYYTDETFDPVTGTATHLRSDFLFSKPVSGYANEDDRSSSQAAEYETWVTGLHSMLRDASDDLVIVTYGGPYITEYEVLLALKKDIILCLVGFGSIFVYMLLHTRSLFLTAAGMFEISISFPTAYFFHRVAMGIEYAGVLQFLSLFIILGIGASCEPSSFTEE